MPHGFCLSLRRKNLKIWKVIFVRKALLTLAVISLLGARPLWGHELIIKPSSFTAEKGSELPVELQSTLVFIVKEEVEDISRITAGIIKDGKIVPSELKGNEAELRIDFSVAVDGDGASILAAEKSGEIWSVTNEGSKPGSRKELEDQGLKVVSAALIDKYAKSIINASSGDKNFSSVLGHDLEIVPVSNPADARAGEYFKVKILHKGEPAAIPAWATYDGFVTEYENTYAYYTESDEEGIANIKITAPGTWLVRASKDNDPGVEGRYDTRSIRATLTFTVK
jgi:uncharacterized GH25 family protein